MRSGKNYFYNPQASTYQFYNEDGLEALQNPQGQMKSFEQIYNEVSTANPSMSAEEKRLLAQQIYETQGGQGMNNTFATDIRNNNQTDDTETGRFGGQYKRGGYLQSSGRSSADIVVVVLDNVD